MEYDCIIVGAGVAGLASALKLSQAGKKVLLLENQPVAGGLATTFKRKGFTFESSIHCINELGEDGEVRRMLRELGIDKQIQLIDLENFSRIIYPRHDFVSDFNWENFIAYLKEQFPAEEKNITKMFINFKKFSDQFEKFATLHLPFWLEMLYTLVFFPQIIKVSSCTIQEMLNRYTKNPELIALISDIWRYEGLPPEKASAFYFLIVFKGYYFHKTSLIKGGTSSFLDACVDKLKESGSEIIFNTKVAKILTKNKMAYGVITDKGREFRGKAIISNANCYSTLCEMLDDDNLKKDYEKLLQGKEKSISAFQVYLGLDTSAKNLGMNQHLISVSTSYDHSENYNYSLKSDYDKCSFGLVDHAQIDSSLVPDGKGQLVIMCLDNYSNWEGLTPEQYKAKKSLVAKKLILRTEKYLPELSNHIEFTETASPLTISRYGLLPEGAIYGLAQTVNQSSISRLAQKTKVKNLFLAGAWTQPGGGFHACLYSGLQAAELVLKFR